MSPTHTHVEEVSLSSAVDQTTTSYYSGGNVSTDYVLVTVDTDAASGYIRVYNGITTVSAYAGNGLQVEAPMGVTVLSMSLVAGGQTRTYQLTITRVACGTGGTNCTNVTV